MVSSFRETDDVTPVVLMGYYNPIYSHGVEVFISDAKNAGVDGLIVVDLPPEEDDELCIPAKNLGLDFIRLATPTTDTKRLPKLLPNTSGFIYYVAVTGVTGLTCDPHSSPPSHLPAVISLGLNLTWQELAQAKAAGQVPPRTSLLASERCCRVLCSNAPRYPC